VRSGSPLGERDPFNGVRRVYALCFLFLMEVIERLGTDRALESLSRAVERQAEIVEKELSSLKGMTDSLERGLEVYRCFMGDLGVQFTVEKEGEEGALIRVGRCPIYEAYLDIGLECGFWMEDLCTHITLPSIEAVLRRFDPRLRLLLERYRASVEEPCLVRMRVEKGG